MPRKIIIIVLMLCVCLLHALTLEEAKQLALQNNSRYLAQKNSYAASRWSKQQALGGLLPSLSLSGSYVYMDPAAEISTGISSYTLNHDVRSAALTLTQPLFVGGKLWQSYKISSISSEISRISLENIRLSILGDVEIKYMNVLQLQELLSIAQKDLQSSSQNLAIAQVRYDNGTISLADYLKAQSRASAKEVTLIQSQTTLELGRQDLMIYLGLETLTTLLPLESKLEESDIIALSLLDTTQTNAFTQKAKSLSMQQNLNLQAVSGTKLLAQKAYNIAKGSFLPTVFLSLSRSFDEDGLHRYEFIGSNTFLLTASLPLLPFWNNYSASRKAYYDVRKSEQDFKSASDGIDLAVRAASLNLISSARQIGAARTALHYSEQAYQQLQERFRNNLLSVTDMLDAEVLLQSARISETNAFYNYLKARTALLQTLGTDSPDILNTLLP